MNKTQEKWCKKNQNVQGASSLNKKTYFQREIVLTIDTSIYYVNCCVTHHITKHVYLDLTFSLRVFIEDF